MKREAAHPLGKSLFAIVQGACSHPQDLMVVEEQLGDEYAISFFPHMADYRILIGKAGRQVKAFQYLTGLAGKRVNLRAMMFIVESYLGNADERMEFNAEPGFGEAQVREVLEPLCREVFGYVPEIEFAPAGERLYVALNLPDEMDQVAHAIGSVLYPYGYRNGRKIQVRCKRLAASEAK